MGSQIAVKAVCLTEVQVEEVELFLNVASQTVVERVLVGLVVALKSLAFLLPLYLSILLGISTGRNIAVLPDHVFPGMIGLFICGVSIPSTTLAVAFLQNMWQYL